MIRVFGRPGAGRGSSARFASFGRHPAGETITLVRTPVDARRQPTGDPPEFIDLDGCTIERRSTVEQSQSLGGVPTDDQRQIVITSVLVHTPPHSGALVTDKVILPGEPRAARPMWRMMSRPWPAGNPFTGFYPGDILELERTDG